ncbi:hypothetical protein [Litorisediminicola beolgyonensis]|uniref:Uncharacterized protein n=1 Tax=Litorisediminicola beolgyonensis TaxID=1173614 RepID=A0ABW3ZLI7_9RHOB
MSDIEDLQRRITAALDRIARGVDGLGAPSGVEDADEDAPEDTGALAAAEARIADLEAAEAGRNAALAEARASVAKLDEDLQRLRRSNEMLRATNDEMRRALEENVGEPHLINKAMLAELESIRAARAADEAEHRALVAALEPLVAEAASRDAEENA